MTPKMTAGRRLRSDMDSLLARARSECGQPALQWDEREQDALTRACATADRAEILRELFDTEQSGDCRATVLAKISAEVRALDRQVQDLLAKLNPGVGPAKSERHQRAAGARWDSRLRSV
ncbi:hypothetical protein [Mycobacteroides abscessus]|uniref:hypothetical protein n=1 Tax=Mycobacteroides abscessus TaxID=36809 RepID=UPI0011C4A210|nr:hypothetical protein [Mycobacteroides abscessus]